MIRLINESSYDSYKDYWAYKEVSKNWESEVEVYNNRDNEPVGAKVIIWYDKGENDKYAEFKIERDEEYDDWFVYDDGMLINDSMDYQNVGQLSDISLDASTIMELKHLSNIATSIPCSISILLSWAI